MARSIDEIRKELLFERDSLEGNINRIMVTNDADELFKMVAYGHSHLNTIFWENYRRVLREEHNHEQENN